MSGEVATGAEPATEAMPAPEPTSAIVTAAEAEESLAPAKTGADLAFVPQNMNDMWRHAVNLSRSTLVPTALRGKPNDVMLVLGIGHDLGLTPFQAVRGIDVIDGKPQVSAQLLRAIVIKSPLCEYFERDDARSSEKQVTYVTKRRGGSGREISYTYTLEDAKVAGLIGKANWKGNPKPMMGHRAAAFLAREVYPDLVGGLYSEGELSELRELDMDRTKADIVAQTEAEAEARKSADPLKSRLEQRAAQRSVTPPAAEGYPCSRCRAPVVAKFGDQCDACRGEQ